LLLNQDASDSLSLIFGEDVTIQDVESYVRINHRLVKVPRRSEGGRAFFSSRHPHEPLD